MGASLLVMAAALLILLPQSRLNSSVLAMLPKQAMGDIPPALNDGFMQRLDRQLVWLISPGKEANRGRSGVADAAAKIRCARRR